MGKVIRGELVRERLFYSGLIIKASLSERRLRNFRRLSSSSLYNHRHVGNVRVYFSTLCCGKYTFALI